MNTRPQAPGSAQSLNRTILELKLGGVLVINCPRRGLNRTILELKHRYASYIVGISKS